MVWQEYPFLFLFNKKIYFFIEIKKKTDFELVLMFRINLKI